MPINIKNIEVELTGILNRRFRNSPLDGKATLEIDHGEGGCSFSVVPIRDSNASIVAFYEDGLPMIYLTVGKETVFEIPIEGKSYTKYKNEEELLNIIDAVISNGFEETVWESNGEIVKSIGKLFLKKDEDPIIVTKYTIHNPFAKKSRVVNKYSPYF